jgi:glycerophosphoryl diester phosphodiesterase
MDILPTKDGTPVVFHDISLKRATGVTADIRQVRRGLLKMLWPSFKTASHQPVVIGIETCSGTKDKVCGCMCRWRLQIYLRTKST